MPVTGLWPRLSDPVGRRRQICVILSPVTSESGGTVARLSAFLSSSEQARMAAFHRERDRIIFAQAHLLLRGCFWRVTGRWDWQLTTGRFGKPELSSPWGTCPLTFNLTHSAGMVACVLAMGFDVGIDAEADYPHSDCLELAQQYFTPVENAWLWSRPRHAQRAAFSSIWTMKEAVLKAKGWGLHGDPRDFTVDVEAQSVAFGVPDSGYAWRTENRRYDGTSLCVAVRGRDQSPSSADILWQTLSAAELVELLPAGSVVQKSAHGVTMAFL